AGVFGGATLRADAARARGGATAGVEEQIKKTEKARGGAVLKADVAPLEGLTADDYVLINASGQVSNKAETMSMIKTGKIKLTANEVSDLKVRVYGDTAVVTGKSTAKGSINGVELKGPVMFTR